MNKEDIASIRRKLKTNNSKLKIEEICMNAIINTEAPSESFMFPSFSEDAADTDKVVYYTKNENKPNPLFVTLSYWSFIPETEET